MDIKFFYCLSKVLNAVPKNTIMRSFKSHLSLDKLYPNSIEIKPFTPPKNNDGKFTGYIPIKALDITHVLASGPGGQHAQKTRTKVDVRFHVKSANWLSDTTKAKLLEKYYSRINKDGYFVIKSEKTRSTLLNTADALTNIREIIYKLEEPVKEPDPETLEKHRKNKDKANRIRLMEKRSRSESKRLLLNANINLL